MPAENREASFSEKLLGTWRSFETPFNLWAIAGACLALAAIIPAVNDEQKILAITLLAGAFIFFGVWGFLKQAGWTARPRFISLAILASILVILGNKTYGLLTEPSLTLQYDSVLLPIKWESGDLHILQIMGRHPRGFGKISTDATHLPQLWPDKDANHEQAIRVKIINNRKSVAYNVRLDFETANELVLRPSKEVMQSGSEMFSYTSGFRIERLDSYEPFIFYVINLSNDFVTVKMPEIAIVDSRKIKLNIPSRGPSDLMPHRKTNDHRKEISSVN